MPLPSEFWFERRHSTPRCRFERFDSLKRRGPQSGRRLDQLLVFHAIGCPGNGLEPFRLDGFAIDDAAPEGAILDPLQRVADLSQHRRLELSFGKVFALPFVGNAVVSAITRRIGDLLPRRRPLVRRTSRKTRFEVEQSLLAMSSIHDALPYRRNDRHTAIGCKAARSITWASNVLAKPSLLSYQLYTAQRSPPITFVSERSTTAPWGSPMTSPPLTSGSRVAASAPLHRLSRAASCNAVFTFSTDVWRAATRTIDDSDLECAQTIVILRLNVNAGSHGFNWTRVSTIRWYQLVCILDRRGFSAGTPHGGCASLNKHVRRHAIIARCHYRRSRSFRPMRAKIHIGIRVALPILMTGKTSQEATMKRSIVVLIAV